MNAGDRRRAFLILAGRLAWVIITALALVLLILSIPANSKQINNDTSFIDVRNFILPPSISRYTLVAYFSALRYAALLVFFAMGLLVFWRKSRDGMGLLTAFVLVLLPASVLRFGGSPEFWRLPGVWYRNLPVVDGALTILGLLCFAAFLYLFPNGAFVPRRLWIAPVSVVAAAATLILGLTNEMVWQVSVSAGLLIVVISLGGQFLRYRSADPATRQQLRWVLAGLIAFPAWMIVSGLLTWPDYPSRVRGWLSLILLHGNVLVPTVLPVALAVATLRYHLWDIDLVIRRTLVYGTLTSTLALVFAVSVIVLQRAFTALTGQESPVALVGSTLAIAALFTPLRSWLQRTVDRRFYRRKYDARRVLELFSQVTRNETDAERLTDGLAAALRETVQPSRITVWLRK